MTSPCLKPVSTLEILNCLEEQVAGVEFMTEDLQSGCAEKTWAHRNIQAAVDDGFFSAGKRGRVRISGERLCHAPGRQRLHPRSHLLQKPGAQPALFLLFEWPGRAGD